MSGFQKFNLKKELIDSLAELKFDNPTEVQDKVIPLALQGKDVAVRSKTGSGKTAAFVIPIVQLIKHEDRAGALIIAPTRELAGQIEQVVRQVGKHSRISTVAIYGGVSMNPQADKLHRGANIVVGTPGRIIDLMERGLLNLDSVRFLVIDEADIMLDMGFIDDVKYIIQSTPYKKQTMLFSATMPGKIMEIARGYMTDSINIGVGEEEELAVTSIENTFALINGSTKFSTLLAYLDHFKPKKSVIFVKTQRTADLLYRIVKDQGFTPLVLHGGITQAKREIAIDAFRSRPDGMLIATNVAARGLDVTDISDIINFDAPDDPTVYIHRIGRSARMGRNGRAFTLFGYDQEDLIDAIQRYAGVKLKKINIDTSKFSKINFGSYMAHRSEGRGSFRGHSGGGGGGGGGNRWRPRDRDSGSRGGGGGGGRDRDGGHSRSGPPRRRHDRPRF